AASPPSMAVLMLLPRARSRCGYPGLGDFTMAPDGLLTRRGERDIAPFVYAGAAILTPAFFAGVPAGPSSLSPLFDRAIAAGRLLGLRLDGVWMHVGTPEAVQAAEAAIVASVAEATAPPLPRSFPHFAPREARKIRRCLPEAPASSPSRPRRRSCRRLFVRSSMARSALRRRAIP